MTDQLIEMDSLDRDPDSCVGVDESEVSVKSGSEEPVKKSVTTNGEVSSPAVTKKKGMRKIDAAFTSCEVSVIALIMLAIIGLFSMPTVFHFLPDSVAQVENTTDTDADCTQVSEYSGEVCRGELTSLQMCFSGVTSPPPALNIPSSIDQQTGESDTMRLVNSLPFLNPSQQCTEEIVPFLCLYTFSLCDSSNTLHTILRQDCLGIRDDVCSQEWSRAVAFLGDGVLPVCEDLPDIIEDCTGKSNMTNTSDLNDQVMPSTGNQSSGQDIELDCLEGFYFDENVTKLCRPICGEFNPTPLSVQIVEDVFIVMCFIASIVMFILALTVQRDKLLVFPSILLVYMCITTFVTSGIIIVGFIDNVALFCKSGDLIDSSKNGNETVFCTISGVIFSYGLQQITMWGGLHATFLFWAVVFPFSYRQLKLSGRMRYAHIISVILAVVVPIPAALVHLLIDGYSASFSPTITCNGRNQDVTYYTFILPSSIIMCVITCLLVAIVWTIFKNLILKKLLTRKKVGNVAKAQLKITAITIHYTLLGVMGLATVTYFDADFFTEVLDYIVCQSTGRASCDVQGIASLDEVLFLAAVIILLSVLPIVVILFSCDAQACCKCKKQNNKRSRTMSSAYSKSSTKR